MEITDAHFREHVTFQFWQHTDYSSSQFLIEEDYSKYRITVDYPEDLEVVTYILNELKNRGSLGSLFEVVEIIESNEEVRKKNSQYFFGQGWDK